MHQLWVKEHNRFAIHLKLLNPLRSDEVTRKLEIQIKKLIWNFSHVGFVSRNTSLHNCRMATHSLFRISPLHNWNKFDEKISAGNKFRSNSL